MLIGKPAPFVRTFVEAVDDAIREHHPSHARSATQPAILILEIMTYQAWGQPEGRAWIRAQAP